MLVNPQIEKLLPHAENRYSLAILIAKRARQLVEGAQPLVATETPNHVSIASEELLRNQIESVKGVKEFYIPIRPEIEAARLEKLRAVENEAAVENIKEMFTQLDEPVEQPERDDPAALLKRIQEIQEDTDAGETDPVAELLVADDAAPADEDQTETED